jgi:Helix-turn-helix domain
MSETYTRDLFAWLDQVCADHKLPPSAFKVAYTIGQYINRKSGKAWPSQPTLAKTVGLTVRTVRELTDQLEAAGHLEIEPHRGRNQTNIYRLAKVSDTVQPEAGKEEADFPLSGEDNRKPASSFADGKAEKEEVPCSKSGSSLHEKRKPASANPSDEPPLNQSEEVDSSDDRNFSFASAAIAAALEKFLELWRRPASYRDDPVKIRKAFIKAAEANGVEAIMASAGRWAAARQPEFLPKPVPWLEEGWRSEPSKPLWEGNCSNGSGKTTGRGNQNAAGDAARKIAEEARAEEARAADKARRAS